MPLARLAFIITLAILRPLSPAYAAHPNNDWKPKSDLFLYDVTLHDGVATEGKLKPNRVYLKFDPLVHAFLFSKTDSRSKLAEPQETLLAGTVVSGNAIGAKNPRQNFLLTTEGKWIPTRDSERTSVLIEQEPPLIRTAEPGSAPRVSELRLPPRPPNPARKAKKR